MGLIIAVVAVAAAGLLVWLIVRSGDEDASASTQPPPYAVNAGSADRKAPPVRQGDDRPGLPQVKAEEGRLASEREPATETIVNGVRVRDHRKDRTKPVTLVPRAPEHARKIPPALTAEISNRLLPIVRECAASVPPEARGEQPRVEGQVVIAIKDRQVRISEATIELVNVAGASVEPTRQCIQQKSLAATAPAADEADLENYPIRISFSLP